MSVKDIEGEIEGIWEMSDYDIGKVQEAAKHDEKQHHDLTIKGDAENVGIIATNAAHEDAHQAEKKKEKDHDIRFLLHIHQMRAELDGLLDHLNKILQDAKDSLGRLNKLQALKDNFDFQEFQILMMEEYGEDVSNLTEEEAKARLDEMFESEKLTFETLVEKFEQKAQEAQQIIDKNPGILDDDIKRQEILNGISREMETLMEQAQADGLTATEIDKAQDKARSNVGENVLLQEHHSDQGDQIYNRTVSFAGSGENDPFADNDPFAETASLSDPFNEVASQTEYVNPAQDGTITNEKELEISQAPDLISPKGLG